MNSKMALIVLLLSPTPIGLISELTGSASSLFPLGLSTLGLLILALKILTPQLLRSLLTLVKIFVMALLLLLANYACEFLGLDTQDVLTQVADKIMPVRWIDFLGPYSGLAVIALLVAVIYPLLSPFWLLAPLQRSQY